MSLELKAIEDQILSLESTIAIEEEVLRGHLEALKQLRLCSIAVRYGVEIGSSVKHRGKVYKVTDIRPWSSGKPWLRGHPKNKNGEWSKRENHLSVNWEVVDE